jgi:hypothetical protein
MDVDLCGPVNLEVTLSCGQAFRWRKVAFPDRPDLTRSYLGVSRSTRSPLWIAALTSALNAVAVRKIKCDDIAGSRSRLAPDNMFLRPRNLLSQLAVFVGQADRVTQVITVAYDSAFASALAPREINEAVRLYFSAGDDVLRIEEALAAQDPAMLEAVNYGHGLRLLLQDRWECLASYILSVNNSILRISRIVEYFASCLGDRVGLGLYGFPSPERFASQETTSMRLSGCGFRDRNLKDAAERVISGEVNLFDIESMPTEQAIERLMRIRGVGPKWPTVRSSSVITGWKFSRRTCG